MNKVCSTCNENKDTSEFAKTKQTADGFHYSCKPCKKSYQANYMASYRKNSENRAKQNLITRKYRKTNEGRAKTNSYRKVWEKQQKLIRPEFKLLKSLRTRVGRFIKQSSFEKNSGIKEILGCSPAELRLHIESQFKEGMDWSNHGKWHLDHIIPLTAAKDITEMNNLNHYTNLQPLWAEDNIRKGNK